MENTTKSEQIEIGALWKKEGKSQKFLAGNLNFENLDEGQWAELVRTKRLAAVVFNNKFKQKDTHPDLRVYLSKPRAEGGAPATTTAPAKAAVKTAVAKPAPAAVADAPDADII